MNKQSHTVTTNHPHCAKYAGIFEFITIEDELGLFHSISVFGCSQDYSTREVSITETLRRHGATIVSLS